VPRRTRLVAGGLSAAGAAELAFGALGGKAGHHAAALATELSERGIKVSHFVVWHFFEHEGISFKKSLHASEQDRPDVARRRAQWKKYQGRLDPARLVFIDETWAKTNMTRSHGRAPRGQRLVVEKPRMAAGGR
jgi:hypothetical protein